MKIEILEGTFCVDAALLGELLDVAPDEVPALMRTGAITSRCEKGTDAHEGEYRLSFFHNNRRARLSVDTSGEVLRCSTIDFGKRPLPPALRKPGT